MPQRRTKIGRWRAAAPYVRQGSALLLIAAVINRATRALHVCVALLFTHPCTLGLHTLASLEAHFSWFYVFLQIARITWAEKQLPRQPPFYLQRSVDCNPQEVDRRRARGTLGACRFNPEAEAPRADRAPRARANAEGGAATRRAGVPRPPVRPPRGVCQPLAVSGAARGRRGIQIPMARPRRPRELLHSVCVHSCKFATHAATLSASLVS